jgi:hypothetical protein
VLVVTNDLFCRPALDHRQRRTPTTDRGKFDSKRNGTIPTGLADEALAQRDHNRLGQRLARTRRELPGEPLGFGMIDVQRHVSIVASRTREAMSV